MKTQNQQVVEQFLAAVQQGNQEVLAALLHPDVQWHQPGNNRISGHKKSITEVFQMVGCIYEHTQGSYALTDIGFVGANGDTVACMLHFSAIGPNSTLAIDNIDVYTVEDGRITDVRVYSQDIEKENAFWGA